MASTIDDTGYNRQRYQDLRRDIAQDWAADGLPDVENNTQSVPGRMVSQTANLQERNDALVQAVIDAFNPYAATGAQQSRLAPVMGKNRNEAAKSTVTLEVTADSNGATIPQGSQSGDGVNKVETRSEVIVAPNGTATVFADAVDFGPINFGAGTITKIETPVFGWASVTNPNAAEPGTNQETDTELRARMLASSSSKSSSDVGIFTALTEIDGVTYAVVETNNTDVANAIGMTPHSVFPIVDGGSDEDIGKALLDYVAGGISTNETIAGATIVTVQVTNPAKRNQKVPIHFGRPTDIPIEIAVTIKETTGLPPDYKQQIKDAISEYISGLEIGSDIYDSDIYCPVNSVGGLRIVSVTLNRVGDSPGDFIDLLTFERASIEQSAITVTVQP
ncbi:baseplate protein J-like protein [Vibrio phage 13VT501A]|nr:baseplate protein J-like protein [Vibrio phage 13VT501A]